MWTTLRLNILVLRFHLGLVKNLTARVLDLTSKLPLQAQLSLSGLAVASAHKAGDLCTAKKLACALVRDIHSPWDLPTIPLFVTPAGITVEQLAVGPMLQIIEALKACPDNTVEESALLEALAKQYQARGVA
jgi:hypothetical protein